MVTMSDIKSALSHEMYLLFDVERAVITISGNDARAFLQRLSTNDIDLLAGDRPVQTCFTNNKGRLVDHVILFEKDAHNIFLVSSHSDPRVIINWLEQYQFVEDVRFDVVNQDSAFRIVIAKSPHLSSLLGNFAVRFWSGSTSDRAEINFYGVIHGNIDGMKISQDWWQTLRIMTLLPTSPHEINQNVMPQNINLADLICEHKGCYVGQEVIAKARTYQKNVKTLCGALVPKDRLSQIFPGSVVVNEHGQLGVVTSVAPIFVPNEINVLVLADLVAKPQTESSNLVPVNFIYKNDDKC